MHRSNLRVTGWLVLLSALAVVPAAATTGSPRAPAAPDSLAIHPAHLDLQVSVDYADGSIDGVATWTIENTGTGPIGAIPVQLGRLMQASAVSRDGRPLEFTQDVVVYDDWPNRQVTQLWVRLDTPLDPGARTDLRIAWSGFLVPYTETGMRYVRDHVERSFTILRAESFGFPQIRVASFEKSRKMPAGEFTWALRVTVPADLVVATGTAERGKVVEDSVATWTFASDTTVPFLLVAIAPYETISEGDLRVFYFPEDSSGARTVLAAMEDAVQTYGRWFGPVGSRLRLHVLEIPEGWGSQADLNAGIIQTADAFRDTTELVQLYHELAHLWHPADVDSAPPRWNEGLATFLSWRMAAERGETGSLEKTFADVAARQVTRFESAGHPGLPMREYGRAGMTGLSYRTGALMFYALYRTLGEQTFDRALSAWFRKYRPAGSTTRQFMDAMEASSGRDLTPLFRDWLLTAGWYERLQAGESLEGMVAGYRK